MPVHQAGPSAFLLHAGNDVFKVIIVITNLEEILFDLIQVELRTIVQVSLYKRTARESLHNSFTSSGLSNFCNSRLSGGPI